MTRTERCVCGATLSLPSLMESWTAPMTEHVQSPRHRLWQQRQTVQEPHLYEEHLGAALRRSERAP